MKFNLSKNFDLTIAVPESKSVGHRDLIVNFLIDLAQDKLINNVKYPICAVDGDSNDIKATKDCINSLYEAVTSKLSGDIKEEVVLACRESGSTLRFFIPVAIAVLKFAGLLKSTKIRFLTEGRLFDRPIDDIKDCLKDHGIVIMHEEKTREIVVSYDSTLDHKGDVYEIDGSLSSQNISGLIMALPLLDTDSKVQVKVALNSLTYVLLTLDVLVKHNVKVRFSEENKLFEVEKDNYKTAISATMTDGDWSSGAFLLCMKEILDLKADGRNLKIEGLNMDSFQGDKAIVDFIDKFKFAQSSGLMEFTYDCKTIPDIVPYMAVWAALYNNDKMTGFKTTFTNVGRLKIKESDRISAIIEILDSINAKSDFDGENLIVYTSDAAFIRGLVEEGRVINLSAHNDHRMAMTDYILGLGTGLTIDIDNITCMTKSFADLPEIMTRNFAI